VSILGELLLQIFVHFPAELVGAGIRGAAAGRNDRRLLSDGQVRCGIRASTGRVLNIGTEWSVGMASFSEGRVHFVPRMGIVGDRTIDVLDLSPCETEPVVGLEGFRAFTLATAKGNLLWAIPPGVADDVVALVRPVGLDAPSERPPHPPRSTDA
jgi:hypothetical protein